MNHRKPGLSGFAARVLGFATTAVLSLGATAVAAQDWPAGRPVTIVVPTSPGTASDLIGREVSQKLSASLGTSVIVDNKGGASGNIATDFVARAKPDGHTLLLGSTSGVINEISNAPKSRLQKDFDPVALTGSTAFALAVPSSFPARSVSDLVAEAKRRPGQLNYAGFAGGIANFLGEMLKSSASIDLVMVPYKSTTDAQADVISGRVHIWFSSTASVNLARSNRIRILAMTSSRRVAAAPEIPTMKEAGYPGMTVEVAFFLLAPAGTPKPVLALLNREINKAMNNKDVVERLLLTGVESRNGTPEDADRALAADFAQWERIISSTRKN